MKSPVLMTWRPKRPGPTCKMVRLMEEDTALTDRIYQMELASASAEFGIGLGLLDRIHELGRISFVYSRSAPMALVLLKTEIEGEPCEPFLEGFFWKKGHLDPEGFARIQSFLFHEVGIEPYFTPWSKYSRMHMSSRNRAWASLRVPRQSFRIDDREIKKEASRARKHLGSHASGISEDLDPVLRGVLNEIVKVIEDEFTLPRTVQFSKFSDSFFVLVRFDALDIASLLVEAEISPDGVLYQAWTGASTRYLNQHRPPNAKGEDLGTVLERAGWSTPDLGAWMESLPREGVRHYGDTEIYTLMGIRSPLLDEEAAFLEWLQAEKSLI